MPSSLAPSSLSISSRQAFSVFSFKAHTLIRTQVLQGSAGFLYFCVLGSVLHKRLLLRGGKELQPDIQRPSIVAFSRALGSSRTLFSIDESSTLWPSSPQSGNSDGTAHLGEPSHGQRSTRWSLISVPILLPLLWLIHQHPWWIEQQPLHRKLHWGQLHIDVQNFPGSGLYREIEDAQTVFPINPLIGVEQLDRHVFFGRETENVLKELPQYVLVFPEKTLENDSTSGQALWCSQVQYCVVGETAHNLQRSTGRGA